MAPTPSTLMSSGSKKKEPRDVCLSEVSASHLHKMCSEVSSSVPHFLQVGLLLSPITCRWLLRVLCLVSRPITALVCVLLTLSVRRPFKLSTLSVRTEYIYSAAFQATSLGGVYILHDFHKLVKKKSIGAIGFRFVPIDPSMFVDSVALFAFVQGQ